MILAPRGGFDLQYFWAQMAILVAPIAWSAASMYSRSLDHDTPPMMMAAWQMLVGGVILTLAGLFAGDADLGRDERLAPHAQFLQGAPDDRLGRAGSSQR